MLRCIYMLSAIRVVAEVYPLLVTSGFWSIILLEGPPYMDCATTNRWRDCSRRFES